MLQRNPRSSRWKDSQFHPDLSIAYIARDARYFGRHGTELSPRKTFQAYRRVLAWAELAERVSGLKLGDEL